MRWGSVAGSLVGSVGLLALLVSGGVLAEETRPNPWLGCWARVYDAAHLAKHPKQAVTAMTLSITDSYHADLTAKLRGKKDTYTNFSGAGCQVAGPNKDRLSCAMGGVFMGQFWLEPAGKDMKLAMHSEAEHIPLVPGVDISDYILLSPQNPEHSLFLLKPTACG
jgi:hypothetical protein